MLVLFRKELIHGIYAAFMKLSSSVGRLQLELFQVIWRFKSLHGSGIITFDRTLYIWISHLVKTYRPRLISRLPNILSVESKFIGVSCRLISCLILSCLNSSLRPRLETRLY